MTRLLTTISLSFATSIMVILPQLRGGKQYQSTSFVYTIPSIPTDALDIIIPSLYDSMKLKKYGLSKQAFKYAFVGYTNLKEKGKLKKDHLLTICDFSQSSKRKRLYVLDFEKLEVLLNTYVAHGKRTGGEYAKSFSNKPKSHQSSLGFYITQQTYRGEHGLSLKLTGLEKGINCKALYRNIVVHGSDYISESYLQKSNYMGRSFGCPAVPKEDNATLINAIKDGSCLFIYYPSKSYLTSSTILKG